MRSTKPTEARLRLLRGLDPHGGVFDRHIRIIGGGEILSGHGSPTPLTCFRDGLIRMNGQRVELTVKGLALLIEVEG